MAEENKKQQDKKVKEEKVVDTKKTEDKTQEKPIKKKQISKKPQTKESKNIEDKKTKETPKKETKIKEEENNEDKKPENQDQENKKQETVKKTQPKKPEIKKEYAFVNGKSLPISTKQAVAICKFITGKKISEARKELEEVIKMRKAIPMKGEIAHKKGKGMMSGKYPIKASKIFVGLLKNLGGNTITNNLDNPIIFEAIPNKASRPMAKFGRWERKRTHVKIIAKDIKQNKK